MKKPYGIKHYDVLEYAEMVFTPPPTEYQKEMIKRFYSEYLKEKKCRISMS